MIHAYYISEVGIERGFLSATNHGSDPFVGSVVISVDQIVAITSRYHGEGLLLGIQYGADVRTSGLDGATGDTWVADIWLTSGDHIWLYDDTIDAANDTIDAWWAARNPEQVSDGV